MYPKERFGRGGQEFTAVIKQIDRWWVGCIEEIPGVNCQERSKTALVDSLREALREAIAFNRAEALRLAENDYSEEKIAV